MKLFLGLLLMVSIAHAEYAPVNSCKLQIGGRCFTAAEVARLEGGSTASGGGLILSAFVTTSLRYSPMKTGSGTAFQAVAQTRCWAQKLMTYTASAGAQLAYSDTVAAEDAATMTNIVYQMRSPGKPAVMSVTGSEIYLGSSGGFVIPIGKYLSIESSGANVAMVAYCLVD